LEAITKPYDLGRTSLIGKPDPPPPPEASWKAPRSQMPPVDPRVTPSKSTLKGEARVKPLVVWAVRCISPVETFVIILQLTVQFVVWALGSSVATFGILKYQL